jgi:outer membrane immunogenic protein
LLRYRLLRGWGSYCEPGGACHESACDCGFGATAFAATSSAWAADLPPPVPFKAPPPAPWYDWTGFYIGGNGGYSWGRASTNITTPGGAAFSGSQNVNGGLGGIQIGYNWQFNYNWVAGLEADIQGTGERGSAGLPTVVTAPGPAAVALPTTTTTGTFSQKLPWFGTFRGRLGVEPADRVLVYATGGLAYGEVDSNSSITASAAFPPAAPFATATANGAARNTQVGWTVGAGVEWRFGRDGA